jgi:outer membrane protein OmpA-like peptidoglycan-associated protein
VRSGHDLAFTLGDDLFAAGKVQLLPQAAVVLDKLSILLAQHPQSRVTIDGYTDNVGTQDDNIALSQARADAVKQYLVARGAAADRIDSVGHGASNAIASNATADGRQRNRRVEVVVETPKDEGGNAAAEPPAANPPAAQSRSWF